jgi:3-hydroxy-5-methyl-1-naphthoate 3-O-methyltransferase
MSQTIAGNQPATSAGTHSTAAAEKPPTAERIMQLAWGYAPPLIIESAIHFGLFDLLAKSPLTAEALAQKSGASLRGTKAIADALVGFAFLQRTGDRYELTPESRAFLVSTSPDFRGGLFKHTIRQLIPRWLQLPDSVRTGQPAIAVNDASCGQEFFVELVESIFPMSYRAAQAAGEALGVPRASADLSVLDIGAGSGVWGIALAQQNPRVRVLSVDWPKVLEVTLRVAKKHGVADRFKTSAGDLLEANFGSGHQIATIGHILHSEGMERSQKLLRRVFDALAPGGHVVIAEFVPNDDRTGPPNALIFAVNMLLHTEHGNTYTFPEISGWLKTAGFEHVRQLEAPSPSPLIVASKPGKE